MLRDFDRAMECLEQGRDLVERLGNQQELAVIELDAPTSRAEQKPPR